MPPIARGTWQHVHVNVRDLLPCSSSVVNQDEEILGPKNRLKAPLCFGNAVHQDAPFRRFKVGQTRDAPLRNNKGMAWTSRKHVEKGVPTFSSGDRVGGNLALHNPLKQGRLAHARAWREVDFNPHADSVGARTQWPETPLRTASVSVVPSSDTRVWCICSSSMSGKSWRT